MEHRIIAIFCLIDEFLKEIGYKDDKRAYISSSEILLIGYLAVSDFIRDTLNICQNLMASKPLKNLFRIHLYFTLNIFKKVFFFRKISLFVIFAIF